MRDDGKIIIIVPVRRAADGRRVTGLPKGHPEDGESAEQAAQREVAEEAGVEVELIGELGDVTYQYERRGRTIDKRVRFYEFRYVSGDVADHDHEIEVARWVDPEEALDVLTYPGEREIVGRVLSRRSADR